MFLENILNSVNHYFLLFPWKKLLVGINSGLANRAVCDLPVCQIQVCMCLLINLLEAVAVCSSTHYCYKVTCSNSSLLYLLM